jgi:hypothetical protein
LIAVIGAFIGGGNERWHPLGWITPADEPFLDTFEPVNKRPVGFQKSA